MYFAFPVCLIRAPPKWNGGELLFPCVCNHVERSCDSTGDELADQGKIEQSPAHHHSTFFFFWPVLFCGPLFVTVSEDLIIMLALSDRCYVYWFLHTDDVGSQALYHFWLLILKYGPLTRKCLSLFFLSVAILHNSVNTPELCTQKWLDGKFFVLCDPAVPHHMWDLCFLSRNWTHTPLHCKVPVHVAFLIFSFFFFKLEKSCF